MALDKQERERLPATLRRSPAKAQDTYIHTLESAEETHGDGEAAHRIAFSALKHSFEKVGDHWEPKEGGRKGPSDAQAAKKGTRARRSTNPARPYICRLIVFSRFTCPSTGPLLHGSVTAAWTHASSRRMPSAN